METSPQTAVTGADSERFAVENTDAGTSTKTGKKLFRASQRTSVLCGVQVLGCGSYVPERIVTNQNLEEQYGFESGWIQQRTGILERRYAAADEATSDLCVKAARRAIDAGAIDPADIDLVLVGTFSPDYLCPSAACLVQEKLGLDAPAVDLHAACAGFMYALVTGMQYVATGNSRLALVIGGDVNSRVVKPSDQGVTPLFGDGAGAVLLGRGESSQGLICYQLGSDGSGRSLLDRPAGGTKRPACADDVVAGLHYLRMDGRNVFKWAVQAVEETIALMLKTTGLQPDDVSLYVLHQANIRIIDHAMQHLGIPSEKVLNNLNRYGNTSGGSIPIVLDEALRDRRIRRGDILLLCGFGAGLTWGTGLFRW